MKTFALKGFGRQLVPGVLAVLVFTALLGLVYPLVMTGIGQVLFPYRADGSIITRDGSAVGSELIGQPFTQPQYFHPRPSAVDYDGTNSYGSNYGPNNEDFLAVVAERVAAYRAENGLAADARVPVDAVTASGSGLDPLISVANAKTQAARVATARGISVDDVLTLVSEHTVDAPLGILGDSGVNVLQLNLALDDLGT
jgi:K+-transporting ATPase ATPase C chain